MPLVYIYKEKLNQPIFGCNNLAGDCAAGSVAAAAAAQDWFTAGSMIPEKYSGNVLHCNTQ